MKKEKEKRTKKPPKALSKILVSLSMLVGIVLVLYPTVADKINDAVNRDVISEYRQTLMTLDDSECEAMLKAAQDYNEHLFQSEPYIGALTIGEREEYDALLNPDGTGVMGYIEIPKVKIYLAIYHGTEDSVLQTGVGHLEASSLPVPGKSVHTVLTGHSGLPSARLFTDLDQLETGDTFTLHILNEILTYQVEEIERVLPDELEDMRIEEGQELCTLMTCTPYGINTHRLVVTGRRIETAAESAPESSPVAQIVASRWNRWFVFLPALLFAAIVTAVILNHKRKKKRQKKQ